MFDFLQARNKMKQVKLTRNTDLSLCNHIGKVCWLSWLRSQTHAGYLNVFHIHSMVVACHRHPGVCLRHLIDRPSIGSMFSPSIRSFSKVELYLKYLNKKPGNHKISDDFTSELNRD